MTVIDWDRSDVLNYLGTYFPRSYAEAIAIFTPYFESRKGQWMRKEELTVFDFGCGTGGEIVGLLTIINESLPAVKSVRVHAFDGNLNALRLLENVIEEQKGRINFSLELKILPFKIEDFYDLSLLDEVLTSRFDIIMSFKAICEFVTKERFEQANAYAHIAQYLLPKLNPEGLMVLEDVTTYNDVSQEWLPRMMDAGLLQADCEVVDCNKGYNECICVSHSQRDRDCSKVAWRIIKSKI